MKLLTFIMGLVISFNVQAQEGCNLEVLVNKDNVSWSSQNGIDKFLFIQNLDTNLLYPQMLTSSTSGTLSLKLFEKNKKGYKVIVADISEQTKNMIDTHLLDCSKRKDCSIAPKLVKIKKSKCSVLKSNIIGHE